MGIFNHPRENVILIRETVHHNMQYLYVFPSKTANAVQNQLIICKSNKTAVNIRAKAVSLALKLLFGNRWLPLQMPEETTSDWI